MSDLLLTIQVNRKFRLYLPSNYNASNNNPVPLLLDFHGCFTKVIISVSFDILTPNQFDIIHLHCFEITIDPNTPSWGNYTLLYLDPPSWGGSPKGQERNFRDLADEEGFLLVANSYINCNSLTPLVVSSGDRKRYG